MAVKDALLPEFDQEMATTRRLLERVPDEHSKWRPHPKSMSLGGLALHLANLLTWVGPTLDESVFDPGAAGRLSEDDYPGRERLLDLFDRNVAEARRRLEACSDERFSGMWTLKTGDRELFTAPRAAVIRSFILSHSIHHRGQLTVYLRLRDVPLPSVYGPTADQPL